MKGTLALTCALTLSLCAALAPPAPAKTVDREFHESFEVTSGARLELTHGDGDVTIEPWDKNLIEVHVRYRADFERKGIGSDLDLEVDFEQSGGTVRVHGKEVGDTGIGFFFRKDHEYTYTIRAPADDGSVSIQLAAGISASFTIETDNGDIEVSPDRVLTKKDNRVTGRIGDGKGRIRVVTDDGDVSLR